jgi:hypothetical protein
VHAKVVLCLVLLVLWLPPTHPQVRPSQLPTTGGPSQDNSSNPDIPPDQQKEMRKKANEQRHAELKRDTDKLLQLSTELKQYVDKSNENILSMDVLRKAEEIEKLAHSVKVKMRGDN